MTIVILNRKGAFLLEALLAVFILSVALVALIRGLLTSMNAVAEAEQYSQAIIAADNALIEVIRLNGKKTMSTVTIENSSEKVKTEVFIKRPDSLDIPGALQQVRVRSYWPGKVKDKDVQGLTLIFGPTDDKE